jgi:hypothetical protein
MGEVSVEVVKGYVRRLGGSDRSQTFVGQAERRSETRRKKKRPGTAAHTKERKN